MKTPKEYLNEVAEENGYDNWEHFCENRSSETIANTAEEAMNRYAINCCKHQIEACANNELVKSFCELEFESDKLKFIKEYLKRTPNVVQSHE